MQAACALVYWYQCERLYISRSCCPWSFFCRWPATRAGRTAIRPLHQGLKLLGSPGAVIDALHAAHGKDNPAAYFSAIVRNGRAVADAGLTHADLEWYGRWKEERRIIGAWDEHYPPQDVQARYRDIGAKLDAMPADQAERLLAGEEAKANKKADPTHRDSKAGK